MASASDAVMRCPWGNKAATTPVVETSLEEVMSEELAKELQIREDKPFVGELDVVADVLANHGLDLAADDCDSDFKLAQLLQTQYDKEYDNELAKQEAKFNGNSKVSVSYSNYKRSCGSDEDYTSSDDDYDKRDWDSFETSQKDSPVIAKCGYSKSKGVITTKHDSAITGRKNACKVMEFPPGIQTGDGGGFDMKLNNSVYNKLKEHSNHENRRLNRLHDKIEKSTTMQALDTKTRLMLRKLVDNGILECINGSVATGKESVVFHALGGRMDEKMVPEECAIKVFKTTLNEFKNREIYIKDDYRFKDRFSKQNPRKVIHMWAEKEMHNLSRMHAAGIPCPQVVLLKKHVLVMSFIGKDGRPAPRLRDAKLSKAEWYVAYEMMLEVIKTLYTKCHLVHADLSEFNTMWHDGQLWVMDVSQAVDTSHPMAYQFLYRDCYNVHSFFKRHDIHDLMGPRELFKHACGIDLEEQESEFLVVPELQEYERNKETLTHGLSNTEFAFDYAWEYSKRHTD